MGGRERERRGGYKGKRARETCVTVEGKSRAAVAINKPRVERESRVQRLRLCPNSHLAASSQILPLS